MLNETDETANRRHGTSGRARRAWLLMALGLSLGCGTPATTTDAGPGPDPDGGHPRTPDDRVIIDRDATGTPHVYAPDLPSAARGLGYAMAEDHAVSLVRLYLGSRARLAASYGAGTANRNVIHDMTVLGYRVPETSAALYPELPQELRDYLEAFAAGMNEYIDAHRTDPTVWEEGFELGDFSVTGLDVLALNRMRLIAGQHAYAQADIRQASGENCADGVDNDGDGRADADDDDCRCPSPIYEDDSQASNAWAVNSPLTTEGHTVLAGDPHLPWDLEPLEKIRMNGDTRFWYEMHLSVAGERFGGALQLGEPILGPGYSSFAAATGTHSGADIGDVYYLERPSRGTYQWGDEVLEVSERQYVIEVLSPTGGITDVPFTMRDARPGPVVCVDATGSVDLSCDATSHAFALVLPSIDHIGSLPTRWGVMHAQSTEELIDALRLQGKDEANLIFATRTGDIVYHLAARLPRREEGVCYGLPQWSSVGPRHEWDGEGHLVIAPFEDHPLIQNPTTGYLVNNNSTPQSSTRGVSGSELPWHNGLFNRNSDGTGGHRNTLAREFFDSATEGTVSREASMGLAMDTEVYGWRALRPILEATVAAHLDIGRDPVAGPAVEALRAWDGRVSATATAPLVFHGWAQRLDALHSARDPGGIGYDNPPPANELTAEQLLASCLALVGGEPDMAGAVACDDRTEPYDGSIGVIPYLANEGLTDYPTAVGALVPWGDVHQLVLPAEEATTGPGEGRPLASGDRLLQTLYMSNSSLSYPDYGIGRASAGSSVMLHVTFTPELDVRFVRPIGNLSDGADPRYGAMADLFASQSFREVVLDGPSEDALELPTL